MYHSHVISVFIEWQSFFFCKMTDERRLALLPTGTIVRDTHHRESPTRHK